MEEAVHHPVVTAGKAALEEFNTDAAITAVIFDLKIISSVKEEQRTTLEAFPDYKDVSVPSTGVLPNRLTGFFFKKRALFFTAAPMLNSTTVSM